MEILYKPTFISQFSKLEKELQEEVLEKIDLFRNQANHKSLKVHKLHGNLKNCFSFSVNYDFRIIFTYVNKKEVHLLDIGTHALYK